MHIHPLNSPPNQTKINLNKKSSRILKFSFTFLSPWLHGQDPYLLWETNSFPQVTNTTASTFSSIPVRTKSDIYESKTNHIITKIEKHFSWLLTIVCLYSRHSTQVECSLQLNKIYTAIFYWQMKSKVNGHTVYQ